MCSFLFCNHIDGEERAGCFALFFFMVSRDCCVALPHDMPRVCLQIAIVAFPDHTSYFIAIFFLNCTQSFKPFSNQSVLTYYVLGDQKNRLVDLFGFI